MTAPGSPPAPPIDYALDFPNVNGMPLWLIPALTDEARTLLVELHTVGRAARHLADYARHTLDVTPATHHRLICDAIDSLLDDEYDELIINTPPGSAKSTYTSHALGAYFLGRSPTLNIILATHTAELAERWSGKVRNTIASPEHQRVFPASQLSRDSTARSRWATSAGGEFLAAGVGASILGFRADLALIDDPIGGFEQAQSITQLTKVHNWYETDLVTRLKPQAKVVLICQRLAPNDLAGYLIARNQLNPTRRQRVLTLRMVVEPDDLPDGTGRAPGERLWPEWYTNEMVEDARRDEFKWKTLYQQRPPSSTGDWVSSDEIQIIEPHQAPPPDAPTYIAADLALSINSGDYTVHLVARTDRDLNLHVVHATRERTSPDESADRALALCETFNPNEYLIDDDNASKVYTQLLARTARDTRRYIPFKSLPLRGQDKETRAASIRGWFKRRKVFLVRAPWNEWLVREILSFPNALGQGVDDGIDCLSLFGRRLASLARPAASPTAPAALRPLAQTATLNELWSDRERSQSSTRRRV